MIQARPGKLLIKRLDSQTEMGNGLMITNETQSRKDVVKGKVVGTEQVVWFPLYAGLPMSYEGVDYLVVDERDVLVEEVE